MVPLRVGVKGDVALAAAERTGEEKDAVRMENDAVGREEVAVKRVVKYREKVAVREAREVKSHVKIAV
jgi:hypothetical protein